MILGSLVVAACACIFAMWKRVEPPAFGQWVTRQNEIKITNDLSRNSKGTKIDFEKKIQPWMELLQQMEI